jgi:hypothetical protein
LHTHISLSLARLVVYCAVIELIASAR